MGLVQDFNAITEMSKEVRRCDRQVRETEGKEAKSKRLSALRENRAAWATALSYVLQDLLCKSRSGKAVAFVQFGLAIQFANAYDEGTDALTLLKRLLEEESAK